jgi:archaellum component FlaG (FlaF/FlaG flagellin family)
VNVSKNRREIRAIIVRKKLFLEDSIRAGPYETSASDAMEIYQNFKLFSNPSKSVVYRSIGITYRFFRLKNYGCEKIIVD